MAVAEVTKSPFDPPFAKGEFYPDFLTPSLEKEG
jgi:hypothetical protein